MTSVPYTKKTLKTECRIVSKWVTPSWGVPAHGYDNDFGDFVRVKSDELIAPLYVDVPRDVFYEAVNNARENGNVIDGSKALFEADEYLSELLRG